MANEIYDSTWWGNTIDTASSIGTSTEMIQGQINMNKLGDDLVVNGDFSNGLNNWVYQGDSITIVDGAARINRITNTTFIQQNILTSNKTYLVEFDVLNKVDNNGTFIVRLGSNNVYDVASYEGTRFSKYIVSNGIDFRIYSSSDNGVITIDNVSVQQVRATTVEASKCLADAIHRIGLQDIQN